MQTLVGFILNEIAKWKQPITKGKISVKGITDEVVIDRDKFGVPHIIGNSKKDILFAEGFTHAQDRLFQLESTRRVATGTLSDWIGEEGLEADKISRTFGFARNAKKDIETLDTETLECIQAYVDGINSYLQSPIFVFPLEFTILWAPKPIPWTIIDVLSIGRILTWQLTYGWFTQIINWLIAQKLKDVPEAIPEVKVTYNSQIPSTLPESVLKDINWKEINKHESNPFLKTSQGSNAWVIAGEYTESGKPFLCSDPHLEPQIPSIWYLIHLKTKDNSVNLIGASIPGLPYILIGHNASISWGITLSYTPVTQVFIERIKFEYGIPKCEKDGVFEGIEIIEETIPIRNGRTHKEIIYITRHGPMINGIMKHSEPLKGDGMKQGFSVQSSYMYPTDFVGRLMKLANASDFSTFKTILQGCIGPGLNIVYADIQGNIGYVLTGKVPIFPPGEDGTYPANGHLSSNDWRGYIPDDKLPFAYNPKEGYIVTCNHKLLDSKTYEYTLGNLFLNGYRAQRLVEMFKEKTKSGRKVTVTDMRAMLLDVTTVVAPQYINLLKYIEDIEDSEIKHAIEALKKWNYKLTPTSKGGAIYQVFKYNLAKNIFTKIMGEELAYYLLGKGFHEQLKNDTGITTNHSNMIVNMLNAEKSYFIEQCGGKKKVIYDAMKEAIQYLTSKFGAKENWNWGGLHTITFPHVIGEKLSVFNRGPYPIGGDEDTVFNFPFVCNKPFDHILCYQSYRQIIDLSSLVNSFYISPTGQSGMLGNNHYDDYIHSYLTGKDYPMLWTAHDIEKASISQLILKETRS